MCKKRTENGVLSALYEVRAAIVKLFLCTFEATGHLEARSGTRGPLEGILEAKRAPKAAKKEATWSQRGAKMAAKRHAK